MSDLGADQSTIDCAVQRDNAVLGVWRKLGGQARRSRRRLPVITQTESVECGLACIAMIAGYYDHHIDLQSLRTRFPSSVRGTTLRHLIDVAAAMDMSSRPLRLDLEELPLLQTPCILHWDLNHFVVLRSATSKRIVIHDPSMGQRILSIAECSTHFTGVALELNTASDFKIQPARARAWLPALLQRSGVWQRLSRIALITLGLEILAITAPLFVQTVMDEVLPNRNVQLLHQIAIGFAVLMLMHVALQALRSWMITCLGTNLIYRWSTAVFQHLLLLPESYFLKRHLGGIITRFSAVDQIKQTISTRFVEFVSDGVMSVITLGMMMLYSARLTLVTLVALLLYILVRAWMFRRTRAASLDHLALAAKRHTLLVESIRGAQTIRVNRGAPTQSARFANITTAEIDQGLVLARLGLVSAISNSVIFSLHRIILYWLGAQVVLAEQMSVGMLVAFAVYAEQFSLRTSAATDAVIDAKMLTMYREQLADITDENTESHLSGHASVASIAPSVELVNVGFRYSESDRWICRGLNLKVIAGESLAIAGPTGCGKSTLAKLIIGLLDPVEGQILIGGIDLKEIGKDRYRMHLGAVLQEDQLFGGTIADNIALFESDADSARIESAARAAHIHEEIMQMPMEYRSLVGDMGSSLSGGQKQRLLLARALYRLPTILVLDEATSHLDIGKEAAVNSTIRGLNMTRVVVAHRPQTLSSMDRVWQWPIVQEESLAGARRA